MRAVGLGTSTPTAPLPGMGATRMDGARIAMARSSARATIRPAFTPGPGTTSNWVTTGPVVRPAILASTLNVRSVSSSDCPSRSSWLSPASTSVADGGVRQLDRRQVGLLLQHRDRRPFGLPRLGPLLLRLHRPGQHPERRLRRLGLGLDGLGRCRRGSLAAPPGLRFVLQATAGGRHRLGRLVATPPLQPLQRVPGEGRERERREREESEEHGAGDTDLVGDALTARNPGSTSDRAGRSAPVAHVRIEVAGPHVGQHADEVGHQHAEPDDQHAPTRFMSSPPEPIEAGQREPEPEQRNAERAGAEQLPERVADAAADRAGEPDGQQGEPEEEAERPAR